MNIPPLIAVDIGNTRIKLGRFTRSAMQGELPTPEAELALPADTTDFSELEPWLSAGHSSGATWCLASVNRPAHTALVDWLQSSGRAGQLVLLSAGDLPLEVALPRPDMVGIDRLLAAVAANRLRRPRAAGVVVGLGSAITVNFLSDAGVFLGGAILPGIAMSARAMHDYTDLLPMLAMQELDEPPPVVGQATREAMQSGLFWGAVGGVRELTTRFAAGSAEVDIFLTGGAAASVARLIAPAARFVPYLTLAGIALAAEHSRDARP